MRVDNSTDSTPLFPLIGEYIINDQHVFLGHEEQIIKCEQDGFIPLSDSFLTRWGIPLEHKDVIKDKIRHVDECPEEQYIRGQYFCMTIRNQGQSKTLFIIYSRERGFVVFDVEHVLIDIVSQVYPVVNLKMYSKKNKPFFFVNFSLTNTNQKDFEELTSTLSTMIVPAIV